MKPGKLPKSLKKEKYRVLEEKPPIKTLRKNYVAEQLKNVFRRKG